MIFRIFFLSILIFVRVKGNAFYGEKKWQPISWEDLNNEWADNLINQGSKNFGKRSYGNFSADYNNVDHDDPEVYSSGFKSLICFVFIAFLSLILDNLNISRNYGLGGPTRRYTNLTNSQGSASGTGSPGSRSPGPGNLTIFSCGTEILSNPGTFNKMYYKSSKLWKLDRNLKLLLQWQIQLYLA